MAGGGAREHAGSSRKRAHGPPRPHRTCHAAAELLGTERWCCGGWDAGRQRSGPKGHVGLGGPCGSGHTPSRGTLHAGLDILLLLPMPCRLCRPQDARVRYYACEALYNIAKVGSA